MRNGGGAGVVGDDAVGDDVGLAFGVCLPGELLRLFDDGPEEVGAVVGVDALQQWRRRRSKPIPVSMWVAGSGSSEPSARRLYWMKTRFQISV